LYFLDKDINALNKNPTSQQGLFNQYQKILLSPNLPF